MPQAKSPSLLQLEIPHGKQPQPKTLLPPHLPVQPITSKDAEAAAPSAKVARHKRPQTKEATIPNPQHQWGRSRHPWKAHNQSTPNALFTTLFSTISDPRSPLKSCHDTQKQTASPRVNRQRASL